MNTQAAGGSPPRMSAPGRNPRPQPDDQAGFAIVEVLIAAVFAIGIAGALFGLLNATARSSAEERHRSQAYALAQEDQARMRALRIPVLNNLNQNRSVAFNGTTYTVNSRAFFVNDTTGTTSCGTNSSADYVRIGSTVTWPTMGSRPPAEIQSIVAPPVGSRDPDAGTLTVTAINAAGQPLPGVGVSGNGPRNLQRLDRRRRLRDVPRHPRRQLHDDHDRPGEGRQ